MAFSALRMAPLPATRVLDGNAPVSELTPRKLAPFQVTCKRHSEVEAPKTISLTRRDSLLLLTTLSATGMLRICSPETADARITKAEMKRRIKEKLEKLREKAGLSNPKNTNSFDKPGKGLPPSSEPKHEKDDNPSPPLLDLEPPPLPLPSPPLKPDRSQLVEANCL